MNFYNLIRKPLFCLDAENAHNLAFSFAEICQRLNFPLTLAEKLYAVNSQRLQVEVFGLTFPSPIGLAAGFDKNGSIVDFLFSLGFGFIEIGSVSFQPCVGNPRPRLFRLEKDKSLINRMGLNNIGAENVLYNLLKQDLKNPIGINLVKTNDAKILGEAALDDFINCFVTMAPAASYVVLNVSCPNTEDGKTFEEPSILRDLLQSVLSKRDELLLDVPILVKFSPDLSFELFEKAIEVGEDFDIDGYVLCNTTLDRSDLLTSPSYLEQIGKGGLSGKSLRNKTLEKIRFVRNQLKVSKTIIGCGGVDTAQSAYEMIKAGASLVELYTGFVYQGPSICRDINLGILRLLEKDGFKHIREAVGVE